MVQTDGKTVCAVPWMTSQSQVTSGNRWIGFRGGANELQQCLRSSQSYVVLAVVWGFLICVTGSMWKIEELMWMSVYLIPNRAKYLPCTGSVRLIGVVCCLLRTCLPFTIMLRVSGLSARHRWALEPSPGSGWCRLATGHRWVAFAPSSLLPCFPFSPPSLALVHSSLQVS